MIKYGYKNSEPSWVKLNGLSQYLKQGFWPSQGGKQANKTISIGFSSDSKSLGNVHKSHGQKNGLKWT